MMLVTGGAGFIGSNLAAALAAQGHDVAVCDRLRTGDKWRNIAKIDLRDVVAPEQLDEWLATRGKPVSIIFHMGTISSTTETDADLILETNFRLSRRLWAWSVRNGRRCIYASSAATYGGAEAGFDDDDSPAGLA